MTPYVCKNQPDPKYLELAKYLWNRLPMNQGQGVQYVRYGGYHFTTVLDLALWLTVELEEVA